MEASVFTDAREFLERAGHLLDDEPRSGLIRGVARGIIADPSRFLDARQFLIERDGSHVAAAMVTPPFDLLLADAADDDAMRALAALIDQRGIVLSGVSGNRPGVNTFRNAWFELTGSAANLEMGQGVFSLEAVNDVPGGPGGFRRATMNDRELIVSWMLDFAAEALPGDEADVERFAAITLRRLEGASEAGFWLWEVDGTPVAMSGQSGPTGSGIRINGVYTPPTNRRRGYATALVAAQSHLLLEGGYRFCFLFTDLSNPTSNAIYRRIGYHQVAESAMYRFEDS